MQKYEIHVSDLITFKSCRRKWDWSSPLRRGLEPERTPIQFLVGRAVHWALAQFYESGVQPSAAFNLFTERALRTEGALWMSESDKLKENLVLGAAMCDNYVSWIKSIEDPDRDWDVVATEVKYETPLFNPLGKLSNRIFLAGRFDQVIRNKHTGSLWLREFKTSKRSPDEEWLDFDDQCTSYAWAAGQIYGEPIRGVQYRFLMKRTPEEPNTLKNGGLSRAINSNLSTTYEVYLGALEKLAQRRAMQDTMKAIDDPSTMAAYADELAMLVADYHDTLLELKGRGWGEYFIELHVNKTETELANQAKELWSVGLEMVRKNIPIYAAPGWMKCAWCQFKTPCRLCNAGANWLQVLENTYRIRQPELEIEEEEVEQ